MMGENDDDKQGQAGQLFENFIQATTCKGTLQAFNILTRQLDLDPKDYRHFYSKLKSKVTSWKAKALWNKLDKRYSQKEYKKGKACVGTKCLIIGGGPCGLRTAIELSCLGAKVVVVEKRDTFSRNNVLHLWPYTIHDLRCLGAKKFYGKFCAGAIDHISIWQLQLMLFKIALLHGIEVHVNVEFVKLLEPPEDQENQKIGWRAEFLPQDHPLSDYEFDVIIGADGRRNTLEGFKRKEFRGKLAIAITANFINRNTTAEAKVEEISGVAFIFNQKFFQDLKEETGIDLENIVYYKDSTHYFVMTAKKQSLLDKGVILNDYADAEMLLCAENVDQENLQSYAREAADFATNYQLPSLDFSINHYGQPDVAMFDFTSMYASDNAALVRERSGHHLLVALVGDSLLEPFWPMGTGCARGFLAAFDTAWMVKSWAQGTSPLEILAERESIYRLLPQTKPENISKNFDQYTLDPGTRYPNLNSNCVRAHQVKHLYITGELHGCPLERVSSIRRSVGITRHESDIRPNKLLTWCQKQTEGYRNVNVTNLTSSWKSGLALCAIIHHFRPELIDFYSLNVDDAVRNNQLAFDIAEKEFGISPITTGKEMASKEEPDKLSMVLYLSKFYELFRGAPLRPVDSFPRDNGKNGDVYSSKPSNLLSNNYLNLTLPRKRVPKGENKSEENDVNKRRRKTMQLFDETVNFSSESINSGNECSDTKEVINQNKVKSMATQLLAKFEENAPNTSLRRQALPLSDTSAPELPPCDPPPVNPRFAKPPDPTPCVTQIDPRKQFQAVARSQQLVRYLTQPTLPATATVTRETARPSSATVTRETARPSSATVTRETARPSSATVTGETARPSSATVTRETTRTSSATVTREIARTSSNTVTRETARTSSATVTRETARPSSATVTRETARPSSATVTGETARPSSTTVTRETARSSATVTRETARTSSATVTRETARTSCATVTRETARSSSTTVTREPARASSATVTRETARTSSATVTRETARPSTATVTRETARSSSTTVTRETARPSTATVTRQPHSREETDTPSSPAEREDSLTSSCTSVLALTGILERLQNIEERAEQKRFQALAIRDFHKKNIREKAAHLASMFGSSDFPQNKLVSPGLSHFPSKLPLYEPHVSDSSTPSSPSISDSAPCDFPSEKIKPPSPGLSHIPSKFPSHDLPVSDPSPSSPSSSSSASDFSPSDAQPRKVLEQRASNGEPRIKHRLFFPDPAQMTVGNVSSRIGAVAEVLVNLYMSDHKSKARSSELSSLEGAVTELFDDSSSSPTSSFSPLHKGSLRKEFPPNIGGSDTCYFCKKRVYVVERLSAEGHFFHRECFKCSFCSSVLRQGNYVFNVEEGKFYCQPHFMHSFSNSKQRKRRTDSKSQDPDKTWKKEEAITAEVMTDSPCSAGSSSEDSSPDEPSSPKKSRSNSLFGIFKRRNSSVSTEWKSVRIGPEEEMADNNLLALRVMVLSDESSSDAEKRPEENRGKINRNRLSSRKKNVPAPTGTKVGHREAQGDTGHSSKAVDALVRASNLPTVTSNKSQRWRQKIQSTFPLLIAKRLSHVSRDSTSSPDDEVFNKNTSEHFNEPNILSMSQEAPVEQYHSIPSYKPHHKALLGNSTALKHGEHGSSTTSTPVLNHQYSFQQNVLSGYGDVDIGNDHLSGNLSDHSDVFEKDENADEGSKQDKSRQDQCKPAQPTLKKLVLSNEEKSKLLDWSSTKPRPPVKVVREQTPSHVNHDPGGEAENKGKSAFAILSSAIKRSFTRSISSAPDSPKTISSSKTKPVSPAGGYLDIPGSFFSRSLSNSESYINPNNTEMSFMPNHLSSSHLDFKASTDGRSSTTGFLSSQKKKQDSPIVEDLPKMLENSDLPFRNRKGSFFSSLRLTDKTSETPSNAPSNDSWYVPWGFRRKANEKEVGNRPHTSSIAASNLQTQPEVKDIRATKSENYSSSDEESTRRRSSSFKSTRTSRQRRKMEKVARRRAKQEELKRLHKAQTIQRQLQEAEEKQRALDIQGIKLEKALRGETDSGAQDEARLLRDWFQLAIEKSKLNRYESGLLSVARELELEDQQGRLEQKVREKMMIDPALRDEKDIAEEEETFAEMMRVIEQRDQLVTRIEEQRLRESSEERNLLDIPLPIDCQLKMTTINNRRFI
ncbi:F-actin-monooxygenase MICAL2 isoform X5 [Rhinoderma darwinii]|uniref:F-actin-monooxygenase MICAL2 isoform X5 n=1 Tax=Rhinoderma darwinii TaxID=43563 RepID=UPI003F67C420